MREAQLLILDEPTAALDARAEVKVFRALQRAEPRQSVALNSRFSSVRMAKQPALRRPSQFRSCRGFEPSLKFAHCSLHSGYDRRFA